MTIKELRESLYAEYCERCKAECKNKPCTALETIAFMKLMTIDNEDEGEEEWQLN